MNQDTKHAYADKMAAQLKEWGAKADVVKAKIAKGTADARIDYHEWVADWHKKESAFRSKLEEVKEASAEGFEKVKAGAQIIWDELSNLMHRASDKTQDAAEQVADSVAGAAKKATESAKNAAESAQKAAVS